MLLSFWDLLNEVEGVGRDEVLIDLCLVLCRWGP